MTLLSANQLCFSYGRRPALDQVNITLSAGEVVALIGPNGSGKSTLIKLLLGHLSGSGQIRWNDQPLQRWSRRELAKLVAYLPQSPQTDVDQRVVDVLRLGRAPYLGPFGLESERDLRIVRLVSQTLGLDELLNRGIDELSGGQRQSIFVGRCLAQEPKAMLLDEPNTFLDLAHQMDLFKLLHRLSKEQSMAVLVASHDLNLAAAFADRLVLISQGRIISSGPPDQVLDPKILSDTYQIPIERIDRLGKPPLVFPRFDD